MKKRQLENFSLFDFQKAQLNKESHRKSINRYRSKLKSVDRKRRIEAWIDSPESISILKKQSGLNQTQVVNALLEIVSKGLGEKFFDGDLEQQNNAMQMLAELQETFQKKLSQGKLFDDE